MPVTSVTAPGWLADGVIYEIYPQSFNDSDGDGIGDLRGVIDKLDYLSYLGVDIIWFNPCFDSSFRDGGYDVIDYLSIAPRYGTNDDMIELFRQAEDRGIRVILDLVAGHTSVDHPWFKESANTPGDDRYIWADTAHEGFVPSDGPRGGAYLKNFFDSQPALNFGYARLSESEPWRQSPDAPGPRRNVQALKDIISFWIDRGAAGFRVDMAYSLVKDDHNLAATTALWREITDWLAKEHPNAVLVPETDEERTVDAGVRAGFSADFFLVIQREHSALFNNGATGVLPWQEAVESCYFSADGDPVEGTAALEKFLGYWNEHQKGAGPDRLIVLPSSDHDFSRVAAGDRFGYQLRGIYVFLLTWGSVPSIYYGDEIGMVNLPHAPETEGSRWNGGYDRAGCRTPMHWNAVEPNDGFSTADAKNLYLPQDCRPDRPTVAAQLQEPGSLLHFVRELIGLRREHGGLRTKATREVLSVGYPFVYLRDGRYLVVVNPRRDAAVVEIGLPGDGSVPEKLIGEGVSISGDRVFTDGFGHAVFDLKG